MTDIKDYLYSKQFNIPKLSLDGSLIRFDRGGTKNAWFIGFENINKKGDTFYVAEFGDWKTGEQYKFISKDKDIDKKDLAAFRKQIKEAKEKAAKEKIDKQVSARNSATSKWEKLIGKHNDLPLHRYAKDKQLKDYYGARANEVGTSLEVPCFSEDGSIWGLQSIDTSGRKMFTKGQRISGCFFVVNLDFDGLSSANTIYLSEGYATACTIHMALECVSVSCFNANNIPKVAKVIRQINPNCKIIICADNDIYTYVNGKQVNAGMKYAGIAAKESNCEVIKPVFLKSENQFTDFNDLMCSEGIESVQKQLQCGDNIETNAKYLTKNDGFHIPIEGKNGNVSWIPDYYELANYIIDTNKLIYNEKYAMVYNGTHYVNVSDNELKKQVIELCQEKLKPSHIDMAFKLVKSKGHKYLTDIPSGVINLANGVLNVNDESFVKHDPSFGFNYVMDINYDPSLKCDKWQTFLFEVLSGDMELMKVMQEMFGYVLLGGNPFLHKAFVLLGEGRNGKSTVLDILRALIGKVNYSAVPISQLHKPFSAIQLRHKLANIVGELSTSVIDSESFKTAVGGEQLVMSHKGKDEFAENVNCRFIFASNRLPNFGDTTTGTYEKLCIIPFNYYIPAEKRDVKIVSKLLAELPGVLNWAVDGSKRIINQGCLTSSEAVKKEVDKWRYSMDPVHRFFVERIRFTENNNDGVAYDLIYKEYLSFCKDQGIKAYTKQSFTQKLSQNSKKYNWEYEKERRREHGSEKKTFLRGISLLN